MSNVTLAIGGRNFVVACAAGEEDHIAGLGRLIDGKLQEMGGATGQSEARSLLFAALLLADEVHELRGNSSAALTAPPGLTSSLASIADRLESCAAALEN